MIFIIISFIIILNLFLYYVINSSKFDSNKKVIFSATVVVITIISIMICIFPAFVNDKSEADRYNAMRADYLSEIEQVIETADVDSAKALQHEISRFNTKISQAHQNIDSFAFGIFYNKYLKNVEIIDKSELDKFINSSIGE